MGEGKDKDVPTTSGSATLRKRTADLPCARCEDRGLGAGAHSNARGALVDPVSYGQQSTTEGSWRDVKKEVAKCERHVATRTRRRASDLL